MTKFGYYAQLFRRLKVPQSAKVVDTVIPGEREFYDGYAPKYCNKPGYDARGQIGKGNTKTIIYKFEGYKFEINEDIEKEGERYAYSIINRDDESICMLIFVPFNDNYAYIDNISYFSGCAMNAMPKSRGGSLMLQVTLNFIELVLKKKYSLKFIRLRDTSYFRCAETKKTIDFDSLYMFTHGSTWYGKYGFVPYSVDDKRTDCELLSDYKLNQKLVRAIPLKSTNVEQYVFEQLKNPKVGKRITKEVMIKIFKNYNDRPIIDFFRDFLRHYDKSCGVFSMIYKRVMKDIGMVDLHGKTYYKKLVIDY
ncbi:MAG: hypothetical protein Harvfovirus43_4 [Harvfovirus sp.]|uniref:Uncharacterized protein n=1 Tax=Harvfovirus sp. TaxID=2487768 RepID=A0A3G5A2Y7_9VIRU|nr:MAG: hypothetical protein Harvfovirus43_4 [Harvfovirus sp.]